jgi:hypothetical protein
MLYILLIILVIMLIVGMAAQILVSVLRLLGTVIQGVLHAVVSILALLLGRQNN